MRPGTRAPRQRGRVIVENVEAQDRIVEALTGLFGHAHVADRRVKPSHGYRAVHVIVMLVGKAIEIQVRTQMQHLWAELSEKLSDMIDPSVKYGGGGEEVQQALAQISALVAEIEALEVEQQTKAVPDKFRAELREIREAFLSRVGTIIEQAAELKGKDDDISD